MYRIYFMFLLLAMSIHGNAQSDSGQYKKTTLKDWISSKKFSFHPMSARTLRGKTIQLTSEYFLKMNQDTLNADLPYYGRSYSAGYPGTDLAIQFGTTQFSYVGDTTKKGSWEITIIPKNESKASKIYMTISKSGYCTMNISSNSRDQISYYGTIDAIKN